ncbi:hypothetical protein ACFXGR_22655 [Streptomyces mirabilis]|uniref:hypothetical protein n=1 Tax=Streptomyces mirabilis TaxID=68239 RepID=UPI00367C6111
MPDVLFSPYATRSDRRRISRDQARKCARYGTPGHLHGRPAVYPRPPKPRPASTRSGQARVNYKRNQRAAFLSHLVALPVSAELADVCDIEQYLRTLHGRIVRRNLRNYGLTHVYWLDVPDAPADAASMTPIYCAHDDRTITVQSIEWRDANGAAIATERTDG